MENNIKIDVLATYVENKIYNTDDINLLYEEGVITEYQKEYLIEILQGKKIRMEEAEEIQPQKFTFEIINLKSKNRIFEHETLEETLKVFAPMDRKEIFIVKDITGRIKYLESGAIIRSNLSIPNSVPIERVAEIYTEQLTKEANYKAIDPQILKDAIVIREELKRTKILRNIMNKGD